MGCRNSIGSINNSTFVLFIYVFIYFYYRTYVIILTIPSGVSFRLPYDLRQQHYLISFWSLNEYQLRRGGKSRYGSFR